MKKSMLRGALNCLYKASGAAAALFIVGIVALVISQVSLNLVDKIFSSFAGRGLGLTIPSYSEFTGFFLAAASFLALAYTLRAGGHIRVTLLTRRFSRQGQRLVEGFALASGAMMACYATFYMIFLIAESIEFNDMTSGMVAIPLWIPQLPIVLGLAILTLALVDDLLALIWNKSPSYEGKNESLLSE